MTKKVAIIGSGFAGLSAAAFMAKAGWQVRVLEKHDQPGGRARRFSHSGFHFDMGPSWYWMPDIFEDFFAQFGKKQSQFYDLHRLDPSYRIYFQSGPIDLPASYPELRELFESFEPGAAFALDRYLREAAFKYQAGMKEFAYKPGRSLTEFFDWNTVRSFFKLDIFSSVETHIASYFKDSRVRQILAFPSLFLGALPAQTPALYSLMNYADIKLGTWYPMGGMYRIVEAIQQVAQEQGAVFSFNSEVKSIITDGNSAKKLILTNGEMVEADVIIGGADYHHIENDLLPNSLQSYSKNYWESRKMAPSSLIFYVGLRRKLEGIKHHSLFFDSPFETHAREIYQDARWPENPLFYMSAVSVTDPGQAPGGCENLFFLIPVAAGLTGDTELLREKYFRILVNRLQQHTGINIEKDIMVKRSFGPRDFANDYHAYKGNAYGLANTLRQTALLKPACRSKKLKNLFYTGQLTVPGPGVPPSLISGEIVAGEIVKYYGKG